MTEIIYRLRNQDEIVGYLREIHGRSFYSKNGYQWSGDSLKYSDTDRFTGYKDRNDKRIFERDVLSSTDYPSDEYIIHYDDLLTRFLLVSYQNQDILDATLEMFFEHKSKVRRIGFLRP